MSVLQKTFLPQPATPLGEDTPLIGRQVPGVMGVGRRVYVRVS